MKVFCIPCNLAEENIACLPNYIIDTIAACKILFVENDRTARRFLKKINPSFLIDDFLWFTLDKHNINLWKKDFVNQLKSNQNIGILSEAGCPGVADPGQELVSIAQANKVTCVPLVGPNSILLSLMASGLNGQSFSFIGYLPIDNIERKKILLDSEKESKLKRATFIFIETPYRNNQLFITLKEVLANTTKLCIASNITASNESIVTCLIQDWKKNNDLDIHKIPTVFLFNAFFN